MSFERYSRSSLKELHRRVIRNSWEISQEGQQTERTRRLHLQAAAKKMKHSKGSITLTAAQRAAIIATMSKYQAALELDRFYAFKDLRAAKLEILKLTKRVRALETSLGLHSK